MQRVFDEGITQYNNRPLAVECLLMSSGRSTKLPDWERMHYHKYIELLYVVSGHYEAYISGSTVDMPARSMAIVNEGETVTIRAGYPARAVYAGVSIQELIIEEALTVRS